MMNKSKYIKRISCFLSVVALFFSASCDKGREVRKYKKQETAIVEQKAKSTSAKGQMAAPAHRPFSWDTPPEWSEAKKKSGMRLATFSIKSQESESRCTIVSLRGTAGGIRANVIRWLGQINVKMDPAGKGLEEFLSAGEKFQTKGKLPAVMFDFTAVTAAPADQSILVTVITMQNSTIFIKMIGIKAHLLENKDKFKSLSRSFALKRGN
jgi:hypothetical protein